MRRPATRQRKIDTVTRSIVNASRPTVANRPAPTVAPKSLASSVAPKTSKLNTSKVKAGQGPTADEKRVADLDARFGNDMAWLDPMFQQEAALLGPAASATSAADPRAIEAQNAALEQLFGIANGGGASALERSRMAKARADQEGWLRGQREADMQDIAERGMGGSGAELVTLGMDRQAAAQRLSQADLDTESMLEQRAMDALMKGGDLAGSMRGQSFSEDSYGKKAADEFSILNQNAINSVGEANKSYLRDAQQQMLQSRNAWDMNRLNQGLDVAGGMLSTDASQNQSGYAYGGNLAGANAGAANQARTDKNTAVQTPSGSAPYRAAADQTSAETMTALGGLMDSYVNTVAAAGGGGMPTGGGSASSGGGGGSGQPSNSNGTFSEDDVWGGQ